MHILIVVATESGKFSHTESLPREIFREGSTQRTFENALGRARHLQSNIFRIATVVRGGSVKLKCIVIDDEPLARDRILDLLALQADIEWIKECEKGFEAINLIAQSDPDLVFLDIQMPDMDGFDVISEIGEDRMPAVIFTTAFHHFASHAFEAGAVDYLLKPFAKDRFQMALDRARTHLRRKRLCEMAQDVRRLLHLAETRESYPDRLPVRSSGAVYFLRPEEISWVEASRNYIKIHTPKHTYATRETMSSLQAKLDPRRFLRIHRSTIVNLDRVRKLETSQSAEAVAELEDGTRLPISRACRTGKIKALLKV